jgi:uncharacterized protein
VEAEAVIATPALRSRGSGKWCASRLRQVLELERMIHPDTELRPAGEAIGLGVFATRPIPRGTIVWVLDELDQRFQPERMRALPAVYTQLLDRYGYLNARGEWVLCWDLARWVNHACDANVLSSGWEVDIAIRDIAAGEEITNDYGCLNLDRSFRCHCGQPGCRRRIDPGDFERLADRWDASVRDAFPLVTQVHQPLWRFVSRPRLVSAAARNPERLPSIRVHRFGLPEAEPRTRERQSA